MNYRYVLAALLAAATLAACSSGGTTLPGASGLTAPANGTALGAAPQSGIRFVVRLAPNSHVRSLTAVSSPTGPAPIVVVKAVDLLPSSPGCANATTGRFCTVVVGLGVGGWNVSVQTFTGVDGKGRELAKGTVTAHVKKGAIETVHVVLTSV
jgi:hypothetical protein